MPSTPSKTASRSTSAGGASILIALSVGSRALTFLVNQVLLRYLSPELLGISTHLEVYSITVLFFARESLRVAIQRQPDEVDDGDYKKTDGDKKKEKVPEGHVSAKTAAGKTQAIVNLSYISIALGTLFAVVLGIGYIQFAYDPVTLAVPYFEESLKLYGIAALWELLSEPFFVVTQQKLNFKVRARAESIATLLRCLATCGSAALASRIGQDIGVLPFALGQGAYAVSILLVYYTSTWGTDKDGGFSFLPKSIYSEDGSFICSYFSKPFFALGSSFFAQSLVKHVLTQGDTLLIAFLSSRRAQGVYALASNYGGLLARVILQPIEESSRNYFGKSLASSDSKPSKEVVEKARDNLCAVLRTYVIASVVVASGGPVVAPILLRFIVGSKWEGTGVEDVVGVYCYYVPLLAINGLTEAFVSSVATKADINRQSTWMLAFSAAFAGAAYYFLGIKDTGAKGIIWANALNMAFRIIWSISFIKNYFKRKGTKFEMISLRPEPMTFAAGLAIYLLLSKLSLFADGALDEIWKSSLVLGLSSIMILVGEQEFLLERYNAFYDIEVEPLAPGAKRVKYDIWGLKIDEPLF